MMKFLVQSGRNPWKILLLLAVSLNGINKLGGSSLIEDEIYRSG